MGMAGTRFGRNVAARQGLPRGDARADGAQPAHDQPHADAADSSRRRPRSTCWPPPGSSSRPTTGSPTAATTTSTSRSRCRRATPGTRTRCASRARCPTTPAPTRDQHLPPTYINRLTHWWDCLEHLRQLRGAARPGAHVHRRQARSSRTAGCRSTPRPVRRITGFSENWWIGLGMLHTLFTLEHNAVCDELKKKHPQMTDDELFGTAQLVISALDRQDPHRRVDAGDRRPPGAQDRHARQLVGPARGAAAPPRRPDRQQRGDQRHPGLARRPARGAVPADRGVHLGLPPAPAAARRARGALAGRRLADRHDGVRRDHPAQRREGAGQRRAGRPTSSTPSASSTPARCACTTSRAGCRTSRCPTASASTSGPSTSSATASAGCRATTSSAASCT